MTRDFLKNLDLENGTKLPDSAVEAIMAEHGRTKPDLKQQISTLTTERDALQTQLDSANATIKSYTDMDIEGIKQSAANWEQKYNTDTQALKDQLAAAEYGYAVEAAVADLKFSSASAKKAFVADLKAKKLPLQDGKLLGLEDFKKTYQETDPDAFAPEGDWEAAKKAMWGRFPHYNCGTLADDARAKGRFHWSWYGSYKKGKTGET